MIAYTASRQGALVYVARNEKKSQDYAIGEDDEDEDEGENANGGAGEEDIAKDDWDNRPRHYAMGMLLCSCCLIRMAFQTKFGVKYLNISQEHRPITRCDRSSKRYQLISYSLRPFDVHIKTRWQCS